MAKNKETAASIEVKLKSLKSEASLRSSFTRQIHGSIDKESRTSFGVIRGEDNSSTQSLMNYITVIDTDIAKYVLYALYDKNSKLKKHSNDLAELAERFVLFCDKYVGVNKERKEQINTDELNKLLKELFPKERTVHTEKRQSMPTLEKLKEILAQQELIKAKEIERLELEKKALEKQEREKKREEKPYTVTPPSDTNAVKLPSPIQPKSKQLLPVEVNNKSTVAPSSQIEVILTSPKTPILSNPPKAEQQPPKPAEQPVLNSTTSIYSESVNNPPSTVQEQEEFMRKWDERIKELSESYRPESLEQKIATLIQSLQVEKAPTIQKEEVKKTPEQEKLELFEMRLKKLKRISNKISDDYFVPGLFDSYINKNNEWDRAKELIESKGDLKEIEKRVHELEDKQRVMSKIFTPNTDAVDAEQYPEALGKLIDAVNQEKNRVREVQQNLLQQKIDELRDWAAQLLGDLKSITQIPEDLLQDYLNKDELILLSKIANELEAFEKISDELIITNLEEVVAQLDVFNKQIDEINGNLFTRIQVQLNANLDELHRAGIPFDYTDSDDLKEMAEALGKTTQLLDKNREKVKEKVGLLSELRDKLTARYQKAPSIISEQELKPIQLHLEDINAVLEANDSSFRSALISELLEAHEKISESLDEAIKKARDKEKAPTQEELQRDHRNRRAKEEKEFAALIVEQIVQEYEALARDGKDVMAKLNQELRSLRRKDEKDYENLDIEISKREALLANLTRQNAIINSLFNEGELPVSNYDSLSKELEVLIELIAKAKAVPEKSDLILKEVVVAPQPKPMPPKKRVEAGRDEAIKQLNEQLALLDKKLSEIAEIVTNNTELATESLMEQLQSSVQKKEYGKNLESSNVAAIKLMTKEIEEENVYLEGIRLIKEYQTLLPLVEREAERLVEEQRILGGKKKESFSNYSDIELELNDRELILEDLANLQEENNKLIVEDALAPRNQKLFLRNLNELKKIKNEISNLNELQLIPAIERPANLVPLEELVIPVINPPQTEILKTPLGRSLAEELYETYAPEVVEFLQEQRRKLHEFSNNKSLLGKLSKLEELIEKVTLALEVAKEDPMLLASLLPKSREEAERINNEIEKQLRELSQSVKQITKSSSKLVPKPIISELAQAQQASEEAKRERRDVLRALNEVIKEPTFNELHDVIIALIDPANREIYKKRFEDLIDPKTKPSLGDDAQKTLRKLANATSPFDDAAIVAIRRIDNVADELTLAYLPQAIKSNDRKYSRDLAANKSELADLQQRIPQKAQNIEDAEAAIKLAAERKLQEAKQEEIRRNALEKQKLREAEEEKARVKQLEKEFDKLLESLKSAHLEINKDKGEHTKHPEIERLNMDINAQINSLTVGSINQQRIVIEAALNALKSGYKARMDVEKFLQEQKEKLVDFRKAVGSKEGLEDKKVQEARLELEGSLRKFESAIDESKDALKLADVEPKFQEAAQQIEKQIDGLNQLTEKLKTAEEGTKKQREKMLAELRSTVESKAVIAEKKKALESEKAEAEALLRERRKALEEFRQLLSNKKTTENEYINKVYSDIESSVKTLESLIENMTNALKEPNEEQLKKLSPEFEKKAFEVEETIRELIKNLELVTNLDKELSYIAALEKQLEIAKKIAKANIKENVVTARLRKIEARTLNIVDTKLGKPIINFLATDNSEIDLLIKSGSYGDRKWDPILKRLEKKLSYLELLIEKSKSANELPASISDKQISKLLKSTISKEAARSSSNIDSILKKYGSEKPIEREVKVTDEDVTDAEFEKLKRQNPTFKSSLDAQDLKIITNEIDSLLAYIIKNDPSRLTESYLIVANQIRENSVTVIMAPELITALKITARSIDRDLKSLAEKKTEFLLLDKALKEAEDKLTKTLTQFQIEPTKDFDEDFKNIQTLKDELKKRQTLESRLDSYEKLNTLTLNVTNRMIALEQDITSQQLEELAKRRAEEAAKLRKNRVDELRVEIDERIVSLMSKASKLLKDHPSVGKDLEGFLDFELFVLKNKEYILANLDEAKKQGDVRREHEILEAISKVVQSAELKVDAYSNMLKNSLSTGPTMAPSQKSLIEALKPADFDRDLFNIILRGKTNYPVNIRSFFETLKTEFKLNVKPLTIEAAPTITIPQKTPGLGSVTGNVEPIEVQTKRKEQQEQYDIAAKNIKEASKLILSEPKATIAQAVKGEALTAVQSEASKRYSASQKKAEDEVANQKAKMFDELKNKVEAKAWWQENEKDLQKFRKEHQLRGDASEGTTTREVNSELMSKLNELESLINEAKRVFGKVDKNPERLQRLTENAVELEKAIVGLTNRIKAAELNAATKSDQGIDRGAQKRFETIKQIKESHAKQERLAKEEKRKQELVDRRDELSRRFINMPHENLLNFFELEVKDIDKLSGKTDNVILPSLLDRLESKLNYIDTLTSKSITTLPNNLSGRLLNKINESTKFYEVRMDKSELPSDKDIDKRSLPLHLKLADKELEIVATEINNLLAYIIKNDPSRLEIADLILAHKIRSRNFLTLAPELYSAVRSTAQLVEQDLRHFQDRQAEFKSLSTKMNEKFQSITTTLSSFNLPSKEYLAQSIGDDMNRFQSLAEKYEKARSLEERLSILDELVYLMPKITHKLTTTEKAIIEDQSSKAVARIRELGERSSPSKEYTAIRDSRLQFMRIDEIDRLMMKMRDAQTILEVNKSIDELESKVKFLQELFTGVDPLIMPGESNDLNELKGLVSFIINLDPKAIDATFLDQAYSTKDYSQLLPTLRDTAIRLEAAKPIQIFIKEKITSTPQATTAPTEKGVAFTAVQSEASKRDIIARNEKLEADIRQLDNLLAQLNSAHADVNRDRGAFTKNSEIKNLNNIINGQIGELTLLRNKLINNARITGKPIDEDAYRGKKEAIETSLETLRKKFAALTKTDVTYREEFVKLLASLKEKQEAINAKYSGHKKQLNIVALNEAIEGLFKELELNNVRTISGLNRRNAKDSIAKLEENEKQLVSKVNESLRVLETSYLKQITAEQAAARGREVLVSQLESHLATAKKELEDIGKKLISREEAEKQTIKLTEEPDLDWESAIKSLEERLKLLNVKVDPVPQVMPPAGVSIPRATPPLNNQLVLYSSKNPEVTLNTLPNLLKLYLSNSVAFTPHQQSLMQQLATVPNESLLDVGKKLVLDLHNTSAQLANDQLRKEIDKGIANLKSRIAGLLKDNPELKGTLEEYLQFELLVVKNMDLILSELKDAKKKGDTGKELEILKFIYSVVNSAELKLDILSTMIKDNKSLEITTLPGYVHFEKETLAITYKPFSIENNLDSDLLRKLFQRFSYKFVEVEDLSKVRKVLSIEGAPHPESIEAAPGGDGSSKVPVTNFKKTIAALEEGPRLLKEKVEHVPQKMPPAGTFIRPSTSPATQQILDTAEVSTSEVIGKESPQKWNELLSAAQRNNTVKVKEILGKLQPAEAFELLKVTKNDQGFSALHFAAAHKDSIMMEAILLAVEPKQRQELLAMQNYIGNTPLHVAAARGNTAVVKSLLDNTEVEGLGVLSVTNQLNKTPFDLAVENKHPIVQRMLLAKTNDLKVKLVKDILSDNEAVALKALSQLDELTKRENYGWVLENTKGSNKLAAMVNNPEAFAKMLKEAASKSPNSPNTINIENVLINSSFAEMRALLEVDDILAGRPPRETSVWGTCKNLFENVASALANVVTRSLQSSEFYDAVNTLKERSKISYVDRIQEDKKEAGLKPHEKS